LNQRFSAIVAENSSLLRADRALYQSLLNWRSPNAGQPPACYFFCGALNQSEVEFQRRSSAPKRIGKEAFATLQVHL